jgi:two-component system phosphate regulon response regulator OmpR
MNSAAIVRASDPHAEGFGGNFCNSLSENQKTWDVKHLQLPEWPLLHLSEVVPMPQNHTRPNKVLVVDDDVRIRDLLRRYLMQEGFEVMLAEDGKALNRVLQREAVDIIVLDLMMPGEDGLSICRRLRANGDRTPIIMLTAKSEDVDRIVGLEVGADDYLGKPFNPRELLARIHAVLRRRPPAEVPGAPSQDAEVVKFGPYEFDLSLRTLRKDGNDLPLTTGEFAMLKALVRHPRQPLSREKLAQLARGREFEPFDRSLDVQVSRLRKLIEDDASSPRYLQTVWGVGYVFVPDGNS